MRRVTVRRELNYLADIVKDLGGTVRYDPKDRDLTAWAQAGGEELLMSQVWFRERGLYHGSVLVQPPYLKEWLVDKLRLRELGKRVKAES